MSPKRGSGGLGQRALRRQTVILLEAKAYVEEAVDFRSQAGEQSLKVIRASLAKAKDAFRASARANWEEPLYQYANRLSHLYYLRALNGIDAHLVFVCFAGAPDVPRNLISASPAAFNTARNERRRFE